jgi:TRAP-type C4-dicarboxylate transport system permease small subunit
VSSSSLHRVLRLVLERVVLVLMASLALIVVAGVVFRKAGASLVWYDEVASIILVWLTYYGACLAALDRAHIGFPNLVRAAPPGLRRILEHARRAVVIAFFLAVAWAGWRVLLVLEGSYLVGLPWVPVRLTQSVIPIGALLFIVAELVSRPGGEAPEAAAGSR